MKIIRSLFLLALLLHLRPLSAAPGDLDAAFGVGGKVITHLSDSTESAYSVALQSDGKIVVAGFSRRTGSGIDDFALVRYSASGELDPSFGVGGKVTTPIDDKGTAYSVLLQSDGKIVVVGTSSINGAARFALARYTAGGELDTTFGAGGKVSQPLQGFYDIGMSAALQSDGKIIVGGSSRDAAQYFDFAVARFNNNGTLDPAFGVGGRMITPMSSISDSGTAVALQADGKIVLAGTTPTGMGVVRYTNGGALDGTFATGGTVITSFAPNDYQYPTSVAVQADGKILVAGRAGSKIAWPYTPTRFFLVRYTSTGELDPAFGNGGLAATPFTAPSEAHSAAVQPDGKILLTGLVFNGNTWDLALVRYTTEGALDSWFGTGGTVVGDTTDGADVAVQEDGKIIVVGSTVAVGFSFADLAVIRYMGGDPIAAAPTVTSGAVTGLTTSGATLNGTVNPNSVATSAQFEYGLTDSYGSTAVVLLSPQAGSSAQAVNAALTNLAPNTQYHYRLTAVNSLGSSATNDATFTTLGAEIVVEQPAGTNLADGGTSNFGTMVVGTSASLTFTIKNVGATELTGLSIATDGPDTTDFAITASPAAPVSGPNGSTTFSIRFSPTTAGTKSATIHIANNDLDESPFDVILSGRALTFAADSDGDGLNDAAEFKLAALGFDWQASQPALVSTLFSNLNGALPNLNAAGYYTPAQVQALHVGKPLLARNPLTGQFTLTIGVKKSKDLVNFSAFPMTESQTFINTAGNLEFTFGVPDNAAFFRLETKP